MLLRRRSLAALAATLAAPAVQAQGWNPTRPIRLIVTYPPGGVNDIVGRIVAEPLGRELGQPVVVENRAGAGGNVGTVAAAQADPDGHTILFGTTALFGVNPILYASSGVNAARDFVSLATIGEVANVLSVVPERLPQVTSVQQLVDEAKRKPLLYGSVGNGSSSHFSAMVFLKSAGIDATHVPYRGSSPLVAAMLSKEVDFGFDTTATSTNHIRSGAFRALAVTTSRRASALPDVPTMQEAGVRDYDLGIWFSLYVLKRTPAPIVARLREALKATRGEQTSQRLRNAFVDPLVVPDDQLEQWEAARFARWQQVTREAGITAD